MASSGSRKRNNPSPAPSKGKGRAISPPPTPSDAGSASPASSTKSATGRRNAKRNKSFESQKKRERRSAKAETERVEKAEREQRKRLGLPLASDHVAIIWVDGKYSLFNRQQLADAVAMGALLPDRFYLQRAMPLLDASPDEVMQIYFKPRDWKRTVDKNPSQAYIERGEAFAAGVIEDYGGHAIFYGDAGTAQQVSPLIEWDRLLHGHEALSEPLGWVYLPRYDADGDEIPFELGPQRPTLDQGFPLRYPDFDAIKVPSAHVRDVLEQRKRAYIARYPPPDPNAPPKEEEPEEPEVPEEPEEVEDKAEAGDKPKRQDKPRPPPETAMISQPDRPPRRAGPFDNLVRPVPADVLGPWRASARRISGGAYDEALALTRTWLAADELPGETPYSTARLVLEAYWVANRHFHRRRLDDLRANRLLGSVEGGGGRALYDMRAPSASGSQRDFPLRGETPEPNEPTELGSLKFKDTIRALAEQPIPRLTAQQAPANAPVIAPVPQPNPQQPQSPPPSPSSSRTGSLLSRTSGKSSHVIKSDMIVPVMDPATAKRTVTDSSGVEQTIFTDPTGKTGHAGDLSILRRQKIFAVAQMHVEKARLAAAAVRTSRTLEEPLLPEKPVRVRLDDVLNYTKRYLELRARNITVAFTKDAYDLLRDIDGIALGTKLGQGVWTPYDDADAELKLEALWPLTYDGRRGFQEVGDGSKPRRVYGDFSIPWPDRLEPYRDFQWAPGVLFPGVTKFHRLDPAAP
ncbi:hypothetical protein JCM10908_002131 [Rhodotorula pacifica]|uniref:uncharacterized protein n=1 Tax=Rhodotorula pacifica TaxID=1495444 RepID=UPI00317279A0